MSISKTLVEHAGKTSFEDIPATAVRIQKQALIDAVAVSMAASSLGEGCKEFIALAEGAKSESGCTVIGCGFRGLPLTACLANGAMAHAMDFEDAHDEAAVHPNAVATAAALTAADLTGNVNGRKFLTAMVLGSDIAIRLALAMNTDALKHGWYMPPVHGAMGAVFAAGKIMDLSEGEMLDALTLTMNQVTLSGELVNSSESVLRSVRDGFAAQAVLLSCMLAKHGLKARFERPLEGDLGYFHAYAHGDWTRERITRGLGQVYESSRISFKPWPSCRGTHPYIEMILRLMSENDIPMADIDKIELSVSPLNEMLFHPSHVKYRPESAINAKFSIPFTAAVAAKYGTVAPEHFTSENFENEEIRSFMRKISYSVNTNYTKTESLHGTMTITAKGKDYFAEVKTPKGSVENPMTDEELKRKFVSCTGYARKGYTAAEAEEIYKLLTAAEEVPDMREVLRLL